MQYYFAGWDNDSDDIFALMESWWEDTPLSEMKIDLDREAFRALNDSGKLICICSRNEEGKLVACFVGFIVPDLYQKGKTKIDQLAACLDKEYRTASNYLDMINTVEKICKKLNVSRLGISTNSRMANVISKRKNYIKDSMSLTKEL